MLQGVLLLAAFREGSLYGISAFADVAFRH